MIIKRDEKKKGYGDRRNEKSIIEKKKWQAAYWERMNEKGLIEREESNKYLHT